MTRAADTEHKIEAAQRRFFGALSLLLTAVLVALVVVLLLLVQSVREAERRDATNNESHRKRNELIHACVNDHITKLRADIAALVKNPAAGFSADDGLHCPPIQP